MEFEKIDLGYNMGCQFHLISSTEFESTAQNVIFAQLKKFEIKLNFLVDDQSTFYKIPSFL